MEPLIKQNFLFKQAQSLLEVFFLIIMVKLPKDFLVSGAIVSPKPGLFWLAGGDWNWEHSQPHSRPAFYSPDFFLSGPTPWAVPSEWVEMTEAELRQALHSEAELLLSASTAAPRGVSKNEFQWESPNPTSFDLLFRELQDQFDQGILKKAVPVVFEHAPLGAVAPHRLLTILMNLLSNVSFADSDSDTKGLAKNSTPLRLYGLWDPQGGILGATPEDLFEVTQEGRVKTMALAGTRRKPRDLQELEAAKAALLSDPKERQEHQWVIDDIQEALSRYGEVRIGETEVLELPTLLHLKTPIELDSLGLSFSEWVRCLHPTAALGAFPRKAGWAWLQAQDQKQKRDRFGAPFGAVCPGKGAICVVAIRNIQWGESGVRLGSGCGVIDKSVAQREWEELALKRDSVKRLMGL